MEKDVLVHGGIEPGIPSSKFTFRYLMHRAAKTKVELLPEDMPMMPSSNAMDKSSKRSPICADDSISETLADRSVAPSASKVPIHDNSKDIVPPKEIFLEGKQDPAAAYGTSNRPVVVSDEAQPQSFPAPNLLAVSKTVESMFVLRECYEKLEKEKQEITSELKLRVQELEKETKLYKAKSVDSDHRISQSMVKVKILETRLEKVKSDSDCIRDKIKKDVIEEFKSSDDFAYALQEQAVKYYLHGFEACKLQLLNSGKLPSAFNLDFLDVVDDEHGKSCGAEFVTDQDKKCYKRKKP